MDVQLQAITNISSRKVFVLLSTEPGKMTIINPEGKILTVPDGLFEAPKGVGVERLNTVFTPEQLEAAGKFYSSERAGTARRKTKAKSGVASGSKKPTRVLAGLGAEWTSSQLTFYRHRIEPLGGKQTFRVTITGVGTFEISKAEFERLFNDVVLSQDYWRYGSFAYSDIPDKARPYIRLNLSANLES